MRSLLLAGVLAGAVTSLHAQQPDTTARRDSVPASLARQAVERYNAPAEVRAVGDVELDGTREVFGSVAVREGWITVGGTVHGSVVVINGNVTLRSTARVDGDVIVVGGFVEGAERASVGGRVLSHPGALTYRLEGEHIVAEGVSVAGAEDSWIRRWRRRHELNSSRIVVNAGTYNRVEGLPINIGGALRQNLPWGRISLDAVGIVRSLEHFRWVDENLGYRLAGEVQYGKLDAVTLGGEAYEVVDGIEDWHLRDSEVGLASFLLHRDFRDYFEREGGRGYLTLRDGARAAFTISVGAEEWGSRSDGDPISLFRNGEPWRENPVVDEGRFRLTSAELTYDTRNDREYPRSGWLLSGAVEHGRSGSVTFGPTSPLARTTDVLTDAVEYTRVFFDLRRYNRLSPTRQLNVRLVLGGWVDGDELPIQRRFSLGGPGTLPGYEFRRTPSGDTDVLQCSEGAPLPGRPAQCERVALAQLEYRADFRLRLPRRSAAYDLGLHRSPAWVLFVDAGRGWLVGPRRVGDLQFTTGSLPPLHTFLIDAGAGLDFNLLGVFVAKSLTDDAAPNVVVRLRQRF